MMQHLGKMLLKTETRGGGTVDIRDSVAIVTGAGSGIGAALSQRLAERGARVVMNDLSAATLHASHRAIATRYPERAAMIAGDCASPGVIHAAVDLAADRFGPVDVYFANAGVGLGTGLDADEHDWAVSLEVNVMAHVRAAEVLIPRWLARGRGHFVATASAAGLLTQVGSATYSVTKHAAVAFAEWLAVTYGSRGISVSCLCPMGVNTAMLAPGEMPSQAAARAIEAVTRSGAVLEPLEVADEVLDSLGTGRFLILPHAEVLEFVRRKASDYDRWIAGMQRYQDSLQAI